MDSRLYSAGYLAIPLKANENSTLNPQPNFIVIENISGRTKAEIPTLGDVVVANSQYKLVYREILEASEQLGRAETMREIIYENENQYVPIMIVPALSDYGYLSQALPQVNGMLSIFQFRGVLSGFVLEIDENKIAEIIVDMTPVIIPLVE
jgi:hypothetical protein